ncbi:U1 zinc finger-domain-containing protein [Fusarium flagelliforme]|uniref:U1 zinc finger-domain-containing protein n=1 Tax=Fusarium flagelliforme TaxID=2675880 RepID=UPI001E8D252A|nr:U1 zinc finger-domain-containing protein [Fusarium flagelliforme]KAH7168148.1 U1 zinc finger-domain-containing protein [Fusarium flagelliforme]
MPKFFCDYCDVYLTHDSMSVRKAHNSGRNHLRNVVDYYQQIGHEKAQSLLIRLLLLMLPRVRPTQIPCFLRINLAKASIHLPSASQVVFLLHSLECQAHLPDNFLLLLAVVEACLLCPPFPGPNGMPIPPNGLPFPPPGGFPFPPPGAPGAPGAAGGAPPPFPGMPGMPPPGQGFPPGGIPPPGFAPPGAGPPGHEKR